MSRLLLESFDTRDDWYIHRCPLLYDSDWRENVFLKRKSYQLLHHCKWLCCCTCHVLRLKCGCQPNLPIWCSPQPSHRTWSYARITIQWCYCFWWTSSFDLVDLSTDAICWKHPFACFLRVCLQKDSRSPRSWRERRARHCWRSRWRLSTISNYIA